MRTMLKKLMAWVLPDKKRNVSPEKERDCMVIGVITVIIPDLTELIDDAEDSEKYYKKINLLTTTLKQTDINYPWRDRGAASLLDFISAERMQERQRRKFDDDGINLYFRPQKRCLSKGQTYAYEKYLKTLASKIGKQLGMEVMYSIEVRPVVLQRNSSPVQF